jgi:hypothetical protein
MGLHFFMSEEPLYSHDLSWEMALMTERNAPTQDPAVGLCLWSYGGPGQGHFHMSEVPLYKAVKARFWP